MVEHKNRNRAALQPLNGPTLALTTLGLGFLRPAPGTWGSVPPVLLAWLLSWAGVATSTGALLIAAVLLSATAACLIWGGYAERRFGRKDAAEVVADETAGVCLPVLVVLLLLPVEDHLFALLGAFLLFRLFDIAKPWPMKRLEQLPAGWGVLVDDLVAGAYAAFIIMATAVVLFNS